LNCGRCRTGRAPASVADRGWRADDRPKVRFIRTGGLRNIKASFIVEAA
jgi:hypothetical protein